MTPEEIKEARETLGFTQKQLGELLFSGIATVRSWEHGRRNMPKLKQAILQRELERRILG